MKYIIFYLYSTIKWKASLDEAASFLDGGEIPCLLVENKIELLDDEYVEDPSLQEFAINNGFCGCFRTSSKTGLNVAESMEFLIRNIIKRIDDWEAKGNKIISDSRKGVVLDPEKHKNNQNKNTGCC